MKITGIEREREDHRLAVAVFNAESSETCNWNRYHRALKESGYAFKEWQKSTYALRSAIRAQSKSRRKP